MTWILAIATILGGVSALWFFWDRIQAHIKRRSSAAEGDDPKRTAAKIDGLVRDVRNIADRPAVLLPKGSHVVGTPWPHNKMEKKRIQKARQLLRRGADLLSATTEHDRETLTEALTRFEQRIQMYEYGELAQVSLTSEHETFEKLVTTLEARHNSAQPSSGANAASPRRSL